MLGGDEDRFAQMMTVRAHALGMAHTTFRNASGLPDWNQVTTARDMAILARHLIQDFPGDYHYFSTPSFVYAGRIVRNHQHLLITYPGADGLKTGYTEAAGYNVATSALHGDTRLIGVVLGAGGNAERDAHMAALLDQGFDRMGVPPLLVARAIRPAIVNVAQASPFTLSPPLAGSLAPPPATPRWTPRHQVPPRRLPRPTPRARIPPARIPAPRTPTRSPPTLLPRPPRRRGPGHPPHPPSRQSPALQPPNPHRPRPLLPPLPRLTDFRSSRLALIFGPDLTNQTAPGGPQQGVVTRSPSS